MVYVLISNKLEQLRYPHFALDLTLPILCQSLVAWLPFIQKCSKLKNQLRIIVTAKLISHKVQWLRYPDFKWDLTSIFFSKRLVSQLLGIQKCSKLKIQLKMVSTEKLRSHKVQQNFVKNMIFQKPVNFCLDLTLHLGLKLTLRLKL